MSFNEKRLIQESVNTLSIMGVLKDSRLLKEGMEDNVKKLFSNIEYEMGDLVKLMRKAKMKESSVVADVLKKWKTIYKDTESSTISDLKGELEKYKGKSFYVPSLGDMKITEINVGDTGYFVAFENSKGEMFNISHKRDGNWDSRISDEQLLAKFGKNTDGAYGPYGMHKYPDFEGLMAKIKKGKFK